MTAWYSGDTVANGIRMHYYRTGGDKPQVVLSHGGSDSGLCWTRLTRALEADYDVIMPDARHHGLSEGPAGAGGFEVQAVDLAEFVRSLGLDRPVIGGHSMGAMSSLYCAALYPDLVRGLILEDGGIGFDLSPSGMLNEERIAAIQRETRAQRALDRDQLIEFGRRQSPKWDEIEFGPWADAKLQARNDLSALSQPPSLTWQDALTRVTCPVLVITGDNSLGSMIRPEHVAEAHQIMPSLEAVNLPGAGHNVRREAFEGYVEALRAFLGRI
jgi:N-formylmaleamate deformylase